MVTLYGIKNCDTVKKARGWLDGHQVDYRFHDLRADGLERADLEAWVTELGWESLLNRRGTTWRGLPEERRESLDAFGAIRLMLEYPTLIKRPVLDLGSRRMVGFSPTSYAEIFTRR